jgi:hypothetical protein
LNINKDRGGCDAIDIQDWEIFESLTGQTTDPWDVAFRPRAGGGRASADAHPRLSLDARSMQSAAQIDHSILDAEVLAAPSAFCNLAAGVSFSTAALAIEQLQTASLLCQSSTAHCHDM